MAHHTATRWIGAAVALVLACAPVCLAAEPAAGPTLHPRKVDWQTDYNLALQEAALTRRPLLVTFTTTWCGWCRKLRGSTFQDQAFVDLSRHMVPVQLDGDVERGLVSLYRVTGYPTTLVMSRSGRELGRIAGYLSADRFVPQLQSALTRREPYQQAKADAAAHPDDPEHLYTYADVLLAVGEYAEARAVLHQIAALATTGPLELLDDVQLDTALSYLFNGEYAASLAPFDAYLEGYPDSERRDEGLFFSGVALMRADRGPEALARLDEAAAMTGMEYIKYEVQRLRAMMEETKKGQKSG